MKQFFVSGKKGIQVQTLILLLIAVVVILVAILASGRTLGEAGALPKIWTEWTLNYWTFLMGGETTVEAGQRAKDDKLLLQFAGELTSLTNACIGATNIPCACVLQEFTLFKENYELKLSQKREGAYFSEPLRGGNQPGLVTDAGVHSVPNEFTFCTYLGQIAKTAELEFYARNEQLYFTDANGEYIIGKGALTLYKPNLKTLCFLPQGVSLPLKAAGERLPLCNTLS